MQTYRRSLKELLVKKKKKKANTYRDPESKNAEISLVEVSSKSPELSWETSRECACENQGQNKKTKGIGDSVTVDR